jgi:hypothetical protein
MNAMVEYHACPEGVIRGIEGVAFMPSGYLLNRGVNRM